MKVSVNWLQEHLAFELPPLAELVTRIGAQLGAVEKVTDIGSKYQGAVIVRVVECARLENSDHLNICFIDDGGVTPEVARRDDGLVQVVCGAPNVTAGITVVWLPPGVTVPSTFDHEPFVLEARELRGVVSNGMLASPKELTIGDSHEGLLILEADDLAPGTNFAVAFKLDDHIIDIENKMFTHRPDCFGQLGVAREVAGILGQSFVSPDWYLTPPAITPGDSLSLTVQNYAPTDVPRFMCVALKDVVIAPSPIWLQTYLSRVGIRPINNVVDITNYSMVLTGQPLHAYDYDKVAALSDGDGAQLVVRYPEPNESIELLSGKTITPRDKAIMIATDRQAIGLGGVMGGGDTEVDADTKNIILECATFDMYSTRRTSMAHGLFTDAVTRYTKGQSPLQNPTVLAKSIALLIALAKAEVASPIIDDAHLLPSLVVVSVDSDFINQRLGLDLSVDAMARLLRNVECKVEVTNQTMSVQVPFWRTDIELPEDVVEEIGRLHGFDKLPLQLPRRSIIPAIQQPLLQLKSAIRASLATAGANELLTYSFVHCKLLDAVGQNCNQAFALGNALSPDLQYYRFNPLPSLLDKVHANIKAGYDEFALFELGKGHSLKYATSDDGLPLEFEDLDLVYASKTPQTGAAFYRVRRLLDALADDLNLDIAYQPFTENPHDPITDAFDLSRSARVVAGNVVLGIVGEFTSSVRRNIKLPDYCAGFSINQRALLKARTTYAGSGYQPLPRFPQVEQDICFRVASDVLLSNLHETVNQYLTANKPHSTRLHVQVLDIYQRDDDRSYKQVTFRVTLASFEKTMTDQEMSTLLNGLAQEAAKVFQAQRI